MQNFLNNFLNIYLITPFAFAIILSIFTYFKNPVNIRRFSNIFFLICFIFSFFLFLLGDNVSTTIFNVDFFSNRITSVFSFVLSFILLLISFFSKTFIFKMHRIFRITLFIMYGLLNFILISDNIFCVMISCIWLFFIFYFLNTSYSYMDKNKRNIFYQLVFDAFIILTSGFLIAWDFLRLFILHDIPFNFSNLIENMENINPISATIGFFGFLLLIFRLYNLIPFNGKIIGISNKVNPLVHTCITLCSMVAGGFLTLKTYLVFSDTFSKYQEAISIILIFNFIYFAVLSIRQDSLIKFSSCIIPPCLVMSLFNLFTFQDNGIIIFAYSLFVNIISYCFLNFAFMVLAQKSKTDNIEKLKKIGNKNKMLALFILFAMFNMAGVPLFSLFSSRFLTFINMFGVESESLIINLIPIILVIGCLILTLNTINILYRIFIAPVETINDDGCLCKNQATALSLLLFIVMISGVFAHDICLLFTQIFTIGSF